MEHSLVLNLLLLMAGTTSLVALCYRIGLSPIIGYLTAGLLFGPYVSGILHESEWIHMLAETGVVLLMFTIGLEFSLPRLLASRRLVLGLGGAQVLLITLVFTLFLMWAGMQPGLAFVLGGAFAMSSTAIALKQLAEQGELGMVHGKITTAILLFQDIAAIPFLVLLPFLAPDNTATSGEIWVTFIKAVAVFIALVAFGRNLLPQILHTVARTHSLELFMLTVLATALSAAALTLLAGLSSTLGAFMAGMLLGETHFRHQVEADIRPFRDLMLGIFFISIGMQLNPQVLITAPLMVLAVLLGLTLIKGLMMYALIRLFSYNAMDAARGAVSLSQGGEFGLLLVAQALSLGLAEAAFLQPVLAGLIISMLLAPVIVRFNYPISQLLHGRHPLRLKSDTLENVAEETADLHGHVIICGYGRLGQGIAHILNEQDFDVVAIDNDPERVRLLRKQEPSLLFGDAANAIILELAKIHQARALAIAFDDEEKARLVLAHVHRLNPDLPVLVRSRHGWKTADELGLNVQVFDDRLESSLMYAYELLVMCGVEPEQAEKTIHLIRTSAFSELKTF
ncbi:Kef-type potassium/proton antiporter (CPA2 family) [Thiogranum longum]|uniref:Kef-type potassium/proton antiporter (CPA2 family) n=1 Tax=Thiogranum longum TaxID=1537524 RepID=A0A4R1HF80_9GAMM|nr:cation:proton antiporter [Thiogranum longum]TCK19323.1 Kef-type potassium/proton antiporter (CPA2 family) [Thiogranum longum]